MNTSTDTMPAVKFFKRGDPLYVQAQRIWLILVGYVMNKKVGPRPPTITYGDLALLMGYESTQAGHMLGRQLGIIGQFCVSNGLPALNSIVVSMSTAAPGAEVVLTGDRSYQQEQQAVSRFDWYSVRVPTTGTFRQVREFQAGRAEEDE